MESVSSDMVNPNFQINRLNMHDLALPRSLHSYSSFSSINTDLAISQSLADPSIPIHTPVECSDKTKGQLVTGLAEKEHGQVINMGEVSVLMHADYTASGKADSMNMPDDGAALKQKEGGEAVPFTSEKLMPNAIADELGIKESMLISNLTSTELNKMEKKFYTFVILHAKEDEEIASRVRDKLEGLGISDGTTFCDGFEHPGCSTIDCLQDAVNNSAFTVLLLTPRWKSRWTVFETNVALMNAIDQIHKYNTVIPFLPLGDQLAKHERPLAVKVLKPLDENSSRFNKDVNNVFKPEVIKKQRAIWKMQEGIQVMQRKTEELEVARDQEMRMKGAVMGLMTTQQKCLIPQPIISV